MYNQLISLVAMLAFFVGGFVFTTGAETATDNAAAVARCDHVLERMRELRQQRQWNTIIEEFGDEDFSSWPPECGGKTAAAFQERGRSHSIRGNREKAGTDFEKAVELSPRNTLFLNSLAGHYQSQNDSRALELYNQVYELTLDARGQRSYNAVPLGATIGGAEFLRNQGRYDEALEILDRYFDHGQLSERLGGWWRRRFLHARAQIFLGQGRDSEALTLFQAALAVE